MGLMDYINNLDQSKPQVDPKNQTAQPSLADELLKKQQALKNIVVPITPAPVVPPKK